MEKIDLELESGRAVVSSREAGENSNIGNIATFTFILAQKINEIIDELNKRS